MCGCVGAVRAKGGVRVGPHQNTRRVPLPAMLAFKPQTHGSRKGKCMQAIPLAEKEAKEAAEKRRAAGSQWNFTLKNGQHILQVSSSRWWHFTLKNGHILQVSSSRWFGGWEEVSHLPSRRTRA